MYRPLLILFCLLTTQITSARTFEEIINSENLRVGTTGDYPPLTDCDRKMECSGFTIDMAELLASYLSITHGKMMTVTYVRTHWSDLNTDLDNDLFDIAMGGITYTKARKKQFLLTDKVIESGKVALIRKEHLPKVTGLNDTFLIAALNRPEIRVVENPGGTNLSFAEQHFPKAQLIITADNKEPFLYLKEGKADVMITDLLEARYRAKKDVSLEIVNPQMFTDTRSHKVYMLPKDSKSLLKEVNEWLQQTDIETVARKWF